MKRSLIDRLLTGLAGLILTFLGVGLFILGIGIFPFTLDLSILEGPHSFWQHVLFALIGLALLLLGLRGVAAIFRSGKQKGFILQRTEYGDLNISMNAMENMVKKCVDMNDELKVTQTKILHTRDGIIVSIRILLENGVNIPIIVSALQKQTKQYITSCSGVDVKEVRVFVDTSANMGLKHGHENRSEVAADADAAEKAGRMVDRLNDAVQKAIQSDAAPKEEEPAVKEPLHQRIFRSKEEQSVKDAADKAKADEALADAAEKEEKPKAAKPSRKKDAPKADPHDEEDVQ